MPVCAAFMDSEAIQDQQKILQVLPAGPLETNAYIFIDKTREEALLIDAPPGVFPMVQSVLKEHGCKLVALLLTHGHWDHIGDAKAIQDLGAEVYAHPGDRNWYENPMTMAVAMPQDLVIEPAKITHWLKGDETLNLLGTSVEVRPVPGHAPGNVLFYFPEHHCAFVGDAIFAGSIGRTDLPGGSFEELEASIKTQIYTLPEDVILLSGHGPETSVAQEKAYNPFVQG